MTLSLAVILIAVFILVYAFFIKIYTILFRLTGVTQDKASFQAISLLTNCGFTTVESEVILSDRFRRRIAMANMITGNVFSVIIVSLVLNVVISLNKQEIEESFVLACIISGSLLLFLILSNIPPIKKFIDGLIANAAIKIIKHGKKGNVINVLQSIESDVICEVAIEELPECMVDKSLMESKIKDEFDINVISYKRNGKSKKADRDVVFQKDDVLVVYGNHKDIRSLFHYNIGTVEEKQKNTTENKITIIDNLNKEMIAKINVRTVPEFLRDKPLYQSILKSNYNITILVVERDGRAVAIDKDTIIQQDDTIVVFGLLPSIKQAFHYDVNGTVRS